MAQRSAYPLRFSAGRDGALYAWSLNEKSPAGESGLGETETSSARSSPKSTYQQHVQAHSHWVNDLVLVDQNQAVVSASSDASVKLWRPSAESCSAVHTIGRHTDYVKCLASPSPHSSWTAAGGLDRRIRLWDLAGAGEILCIDVAGEARPDKGSVYALAANAEMIASGGPESVVKLWDSRSGNMVTKFVGHTDNIRSILISRDNDTLISASADQTIKVWSLTAGRCMCNLTMHSDSVWSLFPGNPQLSILYSGDRSGLVAKTDTRGAVDIDQGISVAVCHENEGINKLVISGDHLWTATASSSINKWHDFDIGATVPLPEYLRNYRTSTVTQRQFSISSQSTQHSSGARGNGQIPLSSILRLSSLPLYPLQAPSTERRRSSVVQNAFARRAPGSISDVNHGGLVPLRNSPTETIEGQNGLIKHIILSDRRHVLTLDTAGEVVMWDLIRVGPHRKRCIMLLIGLKCVSVKTFGRQHLEDVAEMNQTNDHVTNWCTVDTSIGALTCNLDEDHCFDAEVYADQLTGIENTEFKEDQRSESTPPMLVRELSSEPKLRDR